MGFGIICLFEVWGRIRDGGWLSVMMASYGVALCCFASWEEDGQTKFDRGRVVCLFYFWTVG